MKLADLLKKRTAERGVRADKDKFAEPKRPLLDFKQLVEDFKTLDPKDPGLWPLAPRIIILLGLFVGLLAVAWWFGWNAQLDDLEAQKVEEVTFKEEWVAKKTQAVNLDEYRRQLAEIDRSFGALLKQLPNRAEMGDLLVDINKAAQGRGLSVELFKPGGEAPRDFYAEVPITLTLTGGYHDIGGFTGDIAKLPRIVTLNDLNLTAGNKEGSLVLRTTAKTFRYLDEEELARQKKANAGKGTQK
ncbi:MAG: pilus assembly protein PilO [Betaproteobacteria bacterium HGW-Betaproteobacteria-11]|nr:MAG: pilus assembly protein PilO [Betaproteobacteria bacterium HGW-Betaproteobacteria-11]